jgi:hypothetical protein
MPTLTARSIKLVVPLDAAAVLATLRPLQRNEARIMFEIEVDGRRLRCDFAPKAVRKAFGIIAEHGAENVAVIVQGKLGRDDTIAEAGLVAQVKAPKPAPVERERVPA